MRLFLAAFLVALTAMPARASIPFDNQTICRNEEGRQWEWRRNRLNWDAAKMRRQLNRPFVDQLLLKILCNPERHLAESLGVFVVGPRKKLGRGMPGCWEIDLAIFRILVLK
jgi:hypothetical protein